MAVVPPVVAPPVVAAEEDADNTDEVEAVVLLEDELLNRSVKRSTRITDTLTRQRCKSNYRL